MGYRGQNRADGEGNGVVSLSLLAQGRPLPSLTRTVLGRITTTSVGRAMRPDHILIADPLPRQNELRGYAGVLIRESLSPDRAEELGQLAPAMIHSLSF